MTKSTKSAGLQRGLLVGLLVSSTGCFESFFTDDVSFDQWCGDTLCHWEVDRGEIEKVGTWHRSDNAVSLVGDETQISQFRDDLQEDCVRFELIADVEPETRTTLQLDFNGDGTVDMVQSLSTERWKPNVFVIRTPEHYQGVRFILHKAAPGRSIIAQMGASGVEEDACQGPRLELGPQNEGSGCSTDDDCAEGVCAGHVCSLCAEDGTCEWGEPCSDDDHCGSGACTVDVCSECGSDADCDDGEACALDDYPVSHQRTCIAESELPERELGQACSRDAQCKHGYACTASTDDLEPRCGMACEDAGDDRCRGDAQCQQVLAYFDEDWNADLAFVCIAEGDCEDLPLHACDPSGEVVELTED